MKIVYSWLKEIVDITIPAQELADAPNVWQLQGRTVPHNEKNGVDGRKSPKRS